MWLVDKNVTDNYEKAIDLALMDDGFFKNFKAHPAYNSIVGMGSEEQFGPFVEYIDKTPIVKQDIQDIALNDLYGGLNKYLYPGTNTKLSINTLRYAKTIAEIYNYFGSLDDKDITEIGIGYGGLAYVANCVFDNIGAYHLIDLPKPQQLAKKYLAKLHSNYNISFHKPAKSFLTISEFALSELSLDLVQAYYNDVLKNSENLYLMINIHQEPRKQQFLDIISQDFNIERYDEMPKTHWPNDLIIGRHK